MIHDLFLMRHGQTEWNAVGRMQGRLDSPLTDLGRQQAENQAFLVRGIVAYRFASPQGRAQDTARIVFGGLPYQTDARLAEIDVGNFTGEIVDDLRDRHPDVFAPPRLGWYDRVPGGEGFAGLRARVQSFLDDLDGPALIVTHGITLRMLRLVALGWPDSRLEELDLNQGAVHIVRGGGHETWR